MVEKTIMKILEEYRVSLENAGISIDKIILYGSYAKGNPREESDIDVAVISRNFGKDKIEEGMLLFRIAGEVDPRIEPVPISLESYENDTWIPLIYEVRKNGLTIPLQEKEMYTKN